MEFWNVGFFHTLYIWNFWIFWEFLELGSFWNREMVKARSHLNSSFPTRINLLYKLEVHETLLFARRMHGGWFLGSGLPYINIYVSPLLGEPTFSCVWALITPRIAFSHQAEEGDLLLFYH